MKTRLSLLLFVLICTYSCTKVKETIPLPEHPRPDFERETWQNLNGYWKFRPDSANTGLDRNWQNDAAFFDRKILVPFSWASPLSEITLPKVNVGWYARTFTIKDQKKWNSKNVYLVFGASDFNTTVWLNGKKIGNHVGGYVPFDFDISKTLKNDENTLVVRVEDEELKNRPSGKQYYGNAKGIWQTVYLEARSENYISGIRFTPDIDKKEVRAEITFAQQLRKPLAFRLKGKNNDIDFQKEIPANCSVAFFNIPVKDMKTWDFENPFLYEVKASIKGENADDEVNTYFGMRKISTIEIPGKGFKYVALNNKPIYMKLTLDQSYHPLGFYTFPSDQFMKEEIFRAKNLGLNGLRIHIKAEIPRKLYWADKLGLLVMEDIPNFWGEPDSTAKANWEYIAENEMKRDYNHPCIFSFVLFNETWGLFTTDQTGNRSYSPTTQLWVKEKYTNAKQYDPSRLIEDNSPCNLDHVVTDINTWHAYLPARHWSGYLDNIVKNTYPGSAYNYIGGNVQGNQPMFNSECGAVWGYDGSTGDIDLTWEYHIMMNEFRKRPKIAGFLFTEFHDVINEWNGYYRFDRSSKYFGLDELCPGMNMQDFHKDLYVVAGDSFFNQYKADSLIRIPLGINTITNAIPENMKLNYTVYGWDALGEKFKYLSGKIPVTASAFEYKELPPVEFKTPAKNALMILSTTLEDAQGTAIQHNFVPFRVEGPCHIDGATVLTKSPSEFSGASWGIKYRTTQNGAKVWGMGSGYFEYTFEIPENINRKEIKSVEFRAELASRFPQSKYLEKGEAESIGMTVVTEKGTDPGYGQNSYPQTDEKLHGSLVKITANDKLIAIEELHDDPADHTGLLSWMNQKPGWEWGSADRGKPWLLDEAGSYGYLIKAQLDGPSLKNAVETGKITIRLLIDESTANRGGLSVYGKNSGRYPLDPSVIIRF